MGHRVKPRRKRTSESVYRPERIRNRDPKYLETDKAALRAIAQMAINVELFTIPLYMSSLYSIQGMHQVNIENFNLYKGRVWPGLAPTFLNRREMRDENVKPNEKAFNSIFGVFIQEMFHVELASNLANAIGVRPSFTGSPLQSNDNGWVCYGEENTVIPGIVDLRDTVSACDVKVKLGPLDTNSINLFCAIEQEDDAAQNSIKSSKECLYFPEVPFNDWEAGDDLPMFGSIGHMYECYAEYAGIEYKDCHPGKTLFEIMYEEEQQRIHDTAGATFIQRSLFNDPNKAPNLYEFPKISTTFLADTTTDRYDLAIQMMAAIVDQGEGHSDDPRRSMLRFMKGGHPNPTQDGVRKRHQPNEKAIAEKYPSYNDLGQEQPPATHAFARAAYETQTHFQRFDEIRRDLDTIMTWVQWHDDGHVWSGDDLTNSDYDLNSFTPEERAKVAQIPTPEAVATAMNNLKGKRGIQGDRFDDFSRGAVGGIYGIVQALKEFWRDPNYIFPFGAMRATGDRLSIIWAIYGETPNLSLGIGNPDCLNTLHNACQGMSFNTPDNLCAATEAYHTCKNANSCRTQGACGVVSKDCKPVLDEPVTSCTQPDDNFSPPADNQCKTLGGCSVPISSSQMFRVGGTMNLYRFHPENEPGHDEPADDVDDYRPRRLRKTMDFERGDTIYAKAWEAYSEAMKARGMDPGERPEDDDLRVALIPN